MQRRSFLILLLLISCTAGGIRTAWILNHFESLSVDVDGYLDIGRHLAAGDGYSAGKPPDTYKTAFRPPLYPLVVGLALRLTGDLWGLAILQILMGVATVLLVGLTASRCSISPLGCLVAPAIIAFDPILVYVSVTPMTETLCTLLIAAWGYSVTSPSPLRNWFSGLLLGLLALCRPTFLPFIFLQMGLVTLCTLSRSLPLGELRARWGSVLIQFLCISLCLLPWTIRNGLVVGKWTPATTHGGYTLLLGNNATFYREVLHAPWGTSWKGESLLAWQREIEGQMRAEDPKINTEPERDRWFYQLAMRTIRRQPRDFLLSCGWRLARLWDILPQIPLPIAVRWGLASWYLAIFGGGLIGTVVILLQKRWESLLFLLMILNVSAVHLLYWTDLRMRAPLLPLVAILATLGWQTIFGKWRASPQA